MRTRIVVTAALCLLIAGMAFADAPPAPYFDGFETVATGADTWGGDGWNDYGSPTSDLIRLDVTSNGTLSRPGSNWVGRFTQGGPYTRFGGYDPTWPEGGFYESIDIYFDNATSAGSQLEFSMAMSKPDGSHVQDFVYHMHRADSGDGFNVWASNNASIPGFVSGPTQDNVLVDSDGWYTLNTRWYANGDGNLAADMSILGGSGLINTWTRTNTALDVPTDVGGNRYGWFTWNTWDTVYIDNVTRSEALGSDESPEPATWLLLACTGVAGWLRRRRSA